MSNLEQTIAKCKKGDMKAAEQIYNLFAAKMFAVCLRYSNSYHDAEDCLQDGFIKVFDQIEQFKGSGSFEGWMRRIFVHICIERIRKNAKISTTDEFDDITESPPEELFEDLTIEELNEMVNSLPDKYRLVFGLYVQEEMTHKEIAQMLNISEGTSKSNLSRARELLKKRIKELVYEK
ncbi:MAG: RNA polymerase sigma factor [Marinifilaceae bacterium]